MLIERFVYYYLDEVILNSISELCVNLPVVYSPFRKCYAVVCMIFTKYEIRKFTMNFSKNLIKKENKDRDFLEKELNRDCNWTLTHNHISLAK